MIPDLPSLHPTSPGPVELDLFIDSTAVSRGLDGVFRINGSAKSEKADKVDKKVSNSDLDVGSTRQREQHLFTKLENAKLKQNVEQLVDELKALEKTAAAATALTNKASASTVTLPAAASASAPVLSALEDSPARSPSRSPSRSHPKLSRLSHNSPKQSKIDIIGGQRQSDTSPQLQSKQLQQQLSEEDQLHIRLDEMKEENSSLKMVLKDALDRLAQAEQQQLLNSEMITAEVVAKRDSLSTGAVEKENLSLKKQLDESKEEVGLSLFLYYEFFFLRFFFQDFLQLIFYCTGGPLKSGEKLTFGHVAAAARRVATIGTHAREIFNHVLTYFYEFTETS